MLYHKLCYGDHRGGGRIFTGGGPLTPLWTAPDYIFGVWKRRAKRLHACARIFPLRLGLHCMSQSCGRAIAKWVSLTFSLCLNQNLLRGNYFVTSVTLSMYYCSRVRGRTTFMSDLHRALVRDGRHQLSTAALQQHGGFELFHAADPNKI